MVSWKQNALLLLADSFRFKDCIPKELTSGVAYKFQYGLCNE